MTRQAELSAMAKAIPQLIATATLRVATPGAGFTEITANAANFIAQAGAGEGALLVYLRHTSASLTIHENADPDVQRDLVTALDRLAPEDAPWIHDVEGPDDMPAHVKAMLNGVSLHMPVSQRQAGAWHLAGPLSGRASAQGPQPRSDFSVHRQSDLMAAYGACVKFRRGGFDSDFTLGGRTLRTPRPPKLRGA
jgi:secondary thiamine-phosphate synthase enzyme